MLNKSVIHYAKIPDLANREHWKRSDASQRKTRPPSELLILACAFSTILSPLAFAETPASSQSPSVIRGAEAVETVVPNEFNGDLRNLPKMQAPLSGPPIEINPRQQHGGPTVSLPSPVPQLDPLLRSPDSGSFQTQDRLRAPSSFNTPLRNFAGQGFSTAFPPDTVGDVGPNHYIQMINGTSGAAFVIYNKTGGVLVSQTALETLASTAACKNGGGDPIVLYDPLAKRWLLSELAQAGNHLCVYISKTKDPVAGGWWTYDFTTPDFPDYPHYAAWPDAYYVSTNESRPAAYALDRKKMLKGLPASSLRFTAPKLPGFGFQALTPADLDGSTPPPAGAPGYFMRHVDDELHFGASTPLKDYLEIWALHADFAIPANSTLTHLPNIAVADFDSNLCGTAFVGCIPQPGTGVVLDPLREITMWRVQYRNFAGAERLVGNFTVDVNGLDHAGIRWFELKKTVRANWRLAQQGTYSPNAAGRWMGSIAMDGCRNIALGYSVSSATVFPGLRYAGRLRSDAPGTLPRGENSIVAGLSSQTDAIRWGDYSSMNVDPADDRTFWYTNEYMGLNGQWKTRIASFRFPICR